MSQAGPPGAAAEAAHRWQQTLLDRRIPDEIVDQAPVDPWQHRVDMFRVTDDDLTGPDDPSASRARQALPAHGTVLDVGCGGGRASMRLAPPAARLDGVDASAAMLGAFAQAARRRGVSHLQTEGHWPLVAPQVAVADVVVCHHVLYNVADLVPFVTALDAKAQRRVVIEIPQRHPLSWLDPLWERFWGLGRPAGPTHLDAAAVLKEAGLDAEVVEWSEDSPGVLDRLPADERVAFVRSRLCLSPDRDDEIARALADLPPRQRLLATLWWDTASAEA